MLEAEQMKRLSDSIFESAQGDLRRWATTELETLGNYQFPCESPIEFRFVIALFAHHKFINMYRGPKSRYLAAIIRPESVFSEKLDVVLSGPKEERAHVTTLVQPQARIENYRVDFLIKQIIHEEGIDKIGSPFVVECDGHDFHERTADQAEKDRSRDRDLKRLGYSVVRFTGRELWRDAWNCATEIVQLLYIDSEKGVSNA